MSTIPSPPSPKGPGGNNGSSVSLNLNAAAWIQYGALGLVALFLYLGHSFTVDQVRYNREEAREFRQALEHQIQADREATERIRQLVLEVQASIVANQKLIIANQRAILDNTESIRQMLKLVQRLKDKMEENGS